MHLSTESAFPRPAQPIPPAKTRHRRRLSVPVAAGIVAGALLLGAGGARAQSSPSGDVGIDLRRDRQTFTPPAPAEGTLARKNFEISLAAPLLYTTNAIEEDTNAGPTQKSDWHFNPDLLLRWANQYSAVKLSATFDVSVDRFFTETEVDEDTLYGAVKAAFTDGRSDLLIPYVSYAATVDFRPDFRRRDDTLHDLAVGVSSGIGFGPGWHLIRYRDALDPGDTSVTFDIRAGHRFSDPRDFENTFITLTLDASYIFNRQFTVGVAPRFRVRWYDDFFGESRRDYRPSVVLKAVWTPDWLTERLPLAEIDITATFIRNISTDPFESFSLWDVGPAVALAARF